MLPPPAARRPPPAAARLLKSTGSPIEFSIYVDNWKWGEALVDMIWVPLTCAIALCFVVHLLRGGAVDHRLLLAFGLLYYGLVPFFAYASGIYEGGPGAATWIVTFDALYQHSGYALVLFVLAAAAVAASQALPLPQKRLGLDRPIHPILGWAALGLLLIVWGFYLNQAQDLLFSGYELDYRPDLMGPLANVNLVLLLMLLNFWQWRQDRWLMRCIGLLMIANSLALLSMGGRLYVVVAVVGITLKYMDGATGRKPVARSLALAFTIAAAGLLGLVGLLRLGGDFDFGGALQLLLAEPLLTSFSLATLFDCSMVDWLSVPWNFLSSVFNFVPSALLGNKENLIVDLDPSGNCIASPYGATNLGASVLVNFGWIGSILFFFALGYGMRVCKGARGWWLYYYLCSLLPFMLFRDGFQIFNKSFFGTGLLLALALVTASLWLNRHISRQRRAGLARVQGA